jgi:DNA-binding HxlR family transcriptional regulator
MVKCNIFKILGYNGVFEILNLLDYKPRSFSEIMQKTDFNPHIVDRLLKNLIRYHLIIKEGANYKLSAAGKRAIGMALRYNSFYFENYCDVPIEVCADC